MDLALKENEQYKIIDDFLSKTDYGVYWNFTQKANYTVGEVDYPNSVPVGMVSELATDHPLIQNLFPKVITGCTLNRLFLNYYGPRDLSYFHYDHYLPEATTLLYYPCPTYSPDEGGATELMIDDNIVGIRSIANRLLIFRANILHRATPFKSYQRYTYAFKYDPPTPK